VLKRLSLIAIAVFLSFFLALSGICAPEDLFDDINALILRDEYQQAANKCAKILSGRYGSSQKSKAHYLLGLCFLKLGDYDQARKHFNYILNWYSKSKYGDDASLGLADSYLLAGERDQAAKLYKKFLREHPHSDLISIARNHLERCTKGESLNNSYFSVQVGCFANKDNAQKLRDKLAQRGYRAYVLKVSSDNLHHVRVGKFSTRLQAEFLEQQLKSEGYSTKVCP
jgi:tetratricopeptide (TPR) repeat protein